MWGMKLESIKDYYVSSAYEYFGDPDLTIEASDSDMIADDLEKKYPSDKYFTLVDYIRRCDNFHIRVWRLK